MEEWGQAMMCFGLTSSSFFIPCPPNPHPWIYSRAPNLKNPATYLLWKYPETSAKKDIALNSLFMCRSRRYVRIWESLSFLTPQAQFSIHTAPNYALLNENLKSHSRNMADRRGKMTSCGNQKSKAFVPSKCSGGIFSRTCFFITFYFSVHWLAWPHARQAFSKILPLNFKATVLNKQHQFTNPKLI